MQIQPTHGDVDDAVWRIEMMNSGGELLTQLYASDWEQDAANTHALTDAATATGDGTWHTVLVRLD